jgi:hypothetical protein
VANGYVLTGMAKTLKIVGLAVLVMLVLLAIALGGFLYWASSVEESCWKHEADKAFQKYGSFKTRSDILRATADLEKEIGANSVEVLETEFPGCSLGSNGRTILRFYFDDENKLKTIQVFRHAILSDYKQTLIEERRF